MTEYPRLEIQSRPPRNAMKPSQIRRENKLPGIIFGKGINSIPFQIEERAWTKFFRRRPNIFNISVDGKKDILVTLKELAREPGTDQLNHLSFQKLTKGQETTVSIPIKIIGEAKGPLTLILKTIEIKGMPKNMPKNIEVNVESLEPGSYISVSDIMISKGLTIMADAEQTLISCQRRQAEEEEGPVETEETPPEANPA